MAYMCIRNSNYECDGCMECESKRWEDVLVCDYCGEPIRGNIYEDDEYGTLCLRCLAEIHLKEKRAV